MNVTETKLSPKVLEIKQGDKGFKFISGYVEYPRAAILVTDECPARVRLDLQQYESEYVWEKLKE
jgi:DNA-binding transcriptional regulator LsrR (DeoR family)